MPSQKAFKTGSTFPTLPTGTLRLYSMLHCPYAQRARLVLAHKGIEYETVNIHLYEKPGWYLEDINPLGKVPALQKDNTIIYESAIVCEYLDEIHPDNKLTPANPEQKAKDNMLRERFSQVTKHYYIILGTAFNGSEGIDELLLALDVFEKELKLRKTPFFGGESPMMIDIMLWPHMERIAVFEFANPILKLNSERFKTLLEWIQKMKSLPYVQKTMTREDIYKKQFKDFREGKFDMDLGLEE